MADKEEMRTAKGTVPNSKYYEPKGGDEARFFRKHVVKLVDKIRNDQPNRPAGVNGGGEVFDTPPKVKKDETVKAHPDTEAGEDEYVYEEAPPGMEKTVMALKKKFPDKKAFKIAWSMYNKKNEEYIAELGEPMSAAPATSDSPSTGGNQAPTSSSNFKNDMSQNGNGDDDDANVSPIRKELEALALTAAQLYEIMDDQVNDQETSTKISDALISIQEIYDAAANSTNNTSNDKKPTDDNTSGRPDATSNGAQPSMAKESYNLDEESGSYPHKVTYIKHESKDGPEGSVKFHHATVNTPEPIKPGDPSVRINYLIGKSSEHKDLTAKGYKIYETGKHSVAHNDKYYGKPVTYTGEKSESKLHGGQEDIDVARPFGKITAKDLRDLRQKAKMKKKMKSEEVELDETEQFAQAAQLSQQARTRETTQANARKTEAQAKKIEAQARQIGSKQGISASYEPEGDQIDEISVGLATGYLKGRRESELQRISMKSFQSGAAGDTHNKAPYDDRKARNAEKGEATAIAKLSGTAKVNATRDGGLNPTDEPDALTNLRKDTFKKNILANKEGK